MYEINKATLPNGLRLVTVEVPHLHSVMVTAYVRAGSRNDPDGRGGLSHFLEHILFRGCRHYPSASRLNAAVEDLGASLNGVTTRDHGYYYALVHPEVVPKVLEILAHMLASPLLQEIEIEREVILEEILDEVDEEGRVIDVDTISKQVIFGDHSFSTPIAGDRESVSAIDASDLRLHHLAHYGAGNLVLSVAGPIEHEEILSAATASFGSLPPGGKTESVSPAPFPTSSALRLISHRESQSELRMTFPALIESHPDFPAQILLSRILDDGLTSRLQMEIVERRGLAYSVGAGCDLLSDVALFEIDASTTHAKVPRLISAIQSTLAALTREPPAATELARAKTRYRHGVDFMQDSVGDLSAWFGLGELQDRPMTPQERASEIDEVEGEAVRELASRLFVPDRRLTVVVGLAKAEAVQAALGEGWVASGA